MSFRTLCMILIVSCQFSHLTGQVWERFLEEADATVDIISFGDNIGIIGLEHFYYSENGVDWTSANFSEQLSGQNDGGVTGGFFDEQNGILITGNLDHLPTMLLTNDGGETWENFTPEYLLDCQESYRTFDLHILNDSCALLQAIASGIIYKTCDRGKTWNCTVDFYPVPGVWFHTNIVSDSVWYLAADRHHFKTTDGGQTYSKLIDKTFSFVQLEPDGKLYGLTNYLDEPDNIPVLYSSDNDWQTVDSIALSQFQDVFLHLFVVLNEDEIMIFTGLEEVYYSKDGGQTFKVTQDLGRSPFRATKINEEWYLTGRGAFRLNQDLSKVNQVVHEKKLSVYPNPFNEYLDFNDVDHGDYTIVDMNGRIVLDGKLNGSRIDVSTINKGMYLIQVVSENSKWIEKLVKL